MALTLERIPIPDDHIDTLAESDHPPEETVRRALTLYRELDEADLMLREADLLEGDES